MNLEQYSDGFGKLKQLRLERSAAKYTQDGVNLAFSRDNILDILEELADGVNILEFLIGRIETDAALVEAMTKNQGLGMALFGAVSKFLQAQEFALAALWALDTELAPEYRQETTERLVSREDAGLVV